MPTYAYQCKQCGAIFEIRATIQEKEQGLISLTCPQCGAQEARQLLTAGLLLQGGGKNSLPACGCNSGGGCCG